MVYFLEMTVREIDYSIASAVSFSAFFSEKNIQTGFKGCWHYTIANPIYLSQLMG